MKAQGLFHGPFVAYGLVACAFATNCADPCIDDGLRQLDCPRDAAESGAAGSSTRGATESGSGTFGGSQGATSMDGASGSGGQLDTSTTDLGIGDVSGGFDETDTGNGSSSSPGPSTGLEGDSESATGGTLDASTSDGNASTSDGDASTSGDDASTSAGDASTSAGDASTSDGDTSTSDDDASTSDDNASTSGDNASTSGDSGSSGQESGGDGAIFCRDLDGDGFGDATQCVTSDTAPDGWVGVEQGFDCDDASADTFPGAAPLDDEEACMADEDGDDHGDRLPPNGVVPGSDCNDANASIQRCALMVTDDGTADLPYDEPLVDSLEGLGFEVRLIEDVMATAADALGVDVVVISETALSTEISPAFRDLATPVLCMEGYVWDDLGMAPAGVSVGPFDIQIQATTHPVAGGLTGARALVSGSGGGLFQSTLPPTAESIATRVDNPASVILFAYDVGVPMQSNFLAPARRVGFGIDGDRGGQAGMAVLTLDAQRLFESAIEWLTTSEGS